MANKLHVIQNAALRGQALKRALELEFTNMRDRYFTPLPFGEDFLKEERRKAKRARGLEEAGTCRRQARNADSSRRSGKLDD